MRLRLMGDGLLRVRGAEWRGFAWASLANVLTGNTSRSRSRMGWQLDGTRKMAAAATFHQIWAFPASCQDCSSFHWQLLRSAQGRVLTTWQAALGLASGCLEVVEEWPRWYRPAETFLQTSAVGARPPLSK